MALPVVILVGEAKHWVKDLIDKSKNLKLGAGDQPGIDIPPLCYKDLKDRVIGILNKHEEEGGKFLLDGRKFIHP